MKIKRPKIRRPRRRGPTRHNFAASAALAVAIGGAVFSGNSAQALTCSMSGLNADASCTPGTLNADVRQSTIAQTICTSGYTRTVRPPTSYTSPLKREVMRWYGFKADPAGYEFDHLISLELGGNPRDPKNLWPQPYLPKPGAREKDRVENYLHDQVCDGSMTLAQAQQIIRTDWVSIYKQIAK